jgi:hypothetical protein
MTDRPAVSRRAREIAMYWAVFACTWACAGSHREDSLRGRLDEGCSSFDACMKLWGEAKSRLNSCEDVHHSSHVCDPQRTDYSVAEELMRPYREREVPTAAAGQAPLPIEPQESREDPPPPPPTAQQSQAELLRAMGRQGRAARLSHCLCTEVPAGQPTKVGTGPREADCAVLLSEMLSIISPDEEQSLTALMTEHLERAEPCPQVSAAAAPPAPPSNATTP